MSSEARILKPQEARQGVVGGRGSFTDRTALKHAREEGRRLKERFGGVFAAAPSAMAIVDDADNVVAVNPARSGVRASGAQLEAPRKDRGGIRSLSPGASRVIVYRGNRFRSDIMNTGVGRARVGQWYLRWDQGIIIRVTGYDERTGMIRVRSLCGEADEISDETWTALPLGFAELPSGSDFAEPELSSAASIT